MTLIGYARVSTRYQDNALQLDAFKAAGVKRVFQEKVSASSRERPQLDAMLARVKPGDVVLVYKVDRLARSIIDLRRIVTSIAERGGEFRSLTQPFDTSSSMGKLVFQLLGVLAEFERDMIHERCEAGRRAARERGVQFGRPAMWTVERVREIAAMGLGCAGGAQAVGVSMPALRAAATRLGVSFRAYPRQGVGQGS